MIRLENFKGLAIKGGGAAGVAYLGGLKKWTDAKLKLEQFTHFAGSSAGSIVATFLAVRATLEFLEAKLKSTNFSSFLDTSILSKAKDIPALIERYGWNSGDGLETWVSASLGELTGNPDITFGEAHSKYGTHLIITATDVLYPECELLIMDWTTTPEMKIRSAIRRSCSIPFFFQAVFGETSTPEAGHVFIDGGIMNNYPIDLLYQHLPKEQCMGLFLTPLTSKKTVIAKRPAVGYVEVASSIVNAWSDAMMERHVHQDDWIRTCFIPTDLRTTDFVATSSAQERAISGAWTAMERFISAINAMSQENHNPDMINS